MKSLLWNLAGFMAFALWVQLPAWADDKAPQVENAKVLKKLGDFDSIFLSGFTVTCKQQCSDVIILGGPRLEGVKRNWRFTFGGDRIGYLMEMTDYVKPKYENLEESELPDETRRFVPIRTKKWGYWGNDLSGYYCEDTVIAVSPNGEVVDQGKTYDSQVFVPRDEGPNAAQRVMLWSLGRFFSPYLDKVTRVEKTSDGLVRISARGRQSLGYNGRWDLEIDPAAAWMVRKARFYWDTNPDQIYSEMKNTGTVWSGPYCIPKEAVCNYWGPIGEADTEQLTFDPVVEQFDEKLYSEAQQAVAHNKTPMLTIHDFRVSPPVISQPNRPTSAVTLPSRASILWKILVVVSLVVFGLLLVAFFWMWRRVKIENQGSTVQ